MLIWVIIAVFVMVSRCIAAQVNKYGRQQLLDLRPPIDAPVPVPLLDNLKWVSELINTQDASKRSPVKKPRRRRGRKGGVRARLRRRGTRTPLPTIIFGNVQSVRNKIDELAANCKYQWEYRESGFIAVIESWLQDRDVDETVNIDGFSLVRGDRRDIVKQRGGGVAVYINEKWCTQVNIKEHVCCDDLEYLVITCRPFYLPREFSNVIITTVYIPPDANATTASEILVNCVHKYENANPEGINIVLGDFNHCDLQPSLPTYQQYVTCPTRGNSILDKMYCNIKNGYRAFQKPRLGDSDHHMLFLAPTYRQKLKCERCEKISVQEWTHEYITRLQGCFECTDWGELFSESENIDFNVDVFNSYVNFCTDMIIPTKEVTIYPNSKPWINSDVKMLLNEKRRASINGDRLERAEIQRRLNRKIKDAKFAYKIKIENLFRNNKSKDAWNGVKILSGSKKKKTRLEPPNIREYVNDLNTFYTRFDTHDFSAECENIVSIVSDTDPEPLVISYENTLISLKRLRSGKACGPDKIGSRLLKSCSEQLSYPLCKLFQASLDENTVPNVWKKSEIVPIPKKIHPKELNDLRPVALTSIPMKCLEHIVKKILCNYIDTDRDNLQFAYCQNRSVQDAVLTLLHQTYVHLETRNTQVRILFIDFSSAFNTIQPHVLLRKLLELNVNAKLILWIKSYLTERTQYTKINNVMSRTVITNTGAPQGCVLAPLLFSLYTNNCRSRYPNCSIIKYADDTAIVGRISNDNSDEFLLQVNDFVSWCNEHYLNVNVQKTKEMVIDYRVNNFEPQLLIIANEEVERVKEYKYLGIIIDNKLKGSSNAQSVYIKCRQRIHFLRLLRNINVDRAILSLFYKSIIESVLVFSISIWYGTLTVKDKNKLKKIVKTAGRLKSNTESLDVLYESTVMKQVGRIMNDDSHPLHCQYIYLRSGRRLALPLQHTNRFKNSFIPKSIKLFNFLVSR